ncbi:hypothetical protein [Planococcus wigleyi]|uniref:Uncharacterized protein n=1 Tax=Planococcus wigleyi TaxID=2762216 RepID=A0ABR8WBU6_9BACL|nr:hypothetical protein [Planococcus wigleyi]MBD8014231.1 hypothetical protein [Planococcus wigleyi]
MKNKYSSAVERIKTKFNEVSFPKLISFAVPVSVVVTLLYLVSRDIFTLITYTFFN